MLAKRAKQVWHSSKTSKTTYAETFGKHFVKKVRHVTEER